ncbi:hypothetical protein ONS95_006645 [Cadophora gregata]|uniref:uncharacterized protein n=1 Tax=Cadophora gregata TaxID=51156 RepID=UPI0026DD0C9F|nr:uncharacterized protein ONS95_006645 [Cadophora gregata]KAK0101474.1 hypothetical protein ONS95_006645 [Cadophora gregata]
MWKLKRPRSNSDDAMDIDRDGSVPIVLKKVRFGPSSTVPCNRPSSKLLTFTVKENYDSFDGSMSSSISPPKLRRQIQQLRHRKVKGSSPLKEFMSSPSPEPESSLHDVDMDKTLDLHIEETSSSDKESLSRRSMLVSPPIPPIPPSLSFDSATIPRNKFSFLVSGYERIASTAKSQALHLLHPEMAWMQSLVPVENQIFNQINRGRAQPLELEVREFGSFTEEERGVAKRRFGVHAYV